MTDPRTSDSLVSGRLATLKEAQAKAEDAATVITSRYPGSSFVWKDHRTLCVYSRREECIATINLESVQ